MAQLQHNMWITIASFAALSIITGGGKWIEMTSPCRCSSPWQAPLQATTAAGRPIKRRLPAGAQNFRYLRPVLAARQTQARCSSLNNIYTVISCI